MSKNLQLNLVPYIISTAIACCLICLAINTTVPWFDEIVLADKPLNFINRGENYGYLCACTYNLLFPTLETIWFYLFGGSHGTSCAFSLFFSLLSSFALLYILQRRNIIATIGAQISLILLYWFGWQMIWIHTSGRPDTMAMFFTILLAESLAPQQSSPCEKNRLWPFVWSYLLLLTSPSSLPVLFAFGVVILCISPASQRKEVFFREIFAALGMGTSFATMLIYYAVTHELVTFIGVYCLLNNATNANGNPLLAAITSAYRIDLTPLILLSIAGIVALVTKLSSSRRYWVFASLTATVPMLMAPVRYAPYYAWTFHVPSAVMLAYAIRSAKSKLILPILFIASTIVLFAKQSKFLYANAERRALYARCSQLVEDHQSLFQPGKDIVVTEDIDGLGGGFFYPVLNRGCRLWMRGPHILSIPDDETRVRKHIEGVISNTNLINQILAFQKFPAQLPNEATCFFTSQKSREQILPLLAQKNYKEISSLSPTNDYPCFSHWIRAQFEDIKVK